MLIIPFLILLLFFGLLITILLKVKVGLAERLSLSYLLGIGLFTFFVFAFDLLFNINYSINNTFSLLISLCVILFALKYKDTGNFFKSIKIEKEKPKTLTIIFWSFVILVFIYTLVANLYWPVYDWDALALYDFRAKVFLIDSNLIHAALNNSYFIGYPLLTSLAHLFVYQLGLQSPKLIYSFFYLTFIVVSYFSLKRSSNEKKAVFFTILLSLIPEILTHTTIAYTNMAYAIYLLIGTLYIFEHSKDNSMSVLLLSSIFIGLSIWCRSYEPFWIIPMMLVMFITIREHNIKSLLYCLAIICIFKFSWKYFAIYINGFAPLTQSEAALSYLQIIKRINVDNILSIAGYLFKYVYSTWGLLTILLTLTFLRSFTFNKKRNYLVIITILFIILLSVGTLVFSITYSSWQAIPDSARRMGMFFLPLILFSVARENNKQ